MWSGLSSEILRRVFRQELTDISELLTASSFVDNGGCKHPETSVPLYQVTWRNIPQDTCHHTLPRQTQKSHNYSLVVVLLLAERIEEILKRQWQGGSFKNGTSWIQVTSVTEVTRLWVSHCINKEYSIITDFCKILTKNFNRRAHAEEQDVRCDDNIKVDRGEIVFAVRNWSEVYQDRVQWLNFVNMVMKFQGSLKSKNLLTDLLSIFQRRPCSL